MKTNLLQDNIPKGWEIKKIKDLLSFEQPTKYIVESSSYTPDGKTPVLTANKSFVLGYTNETDGVYTNIPAIIFDDFTTDSKYADFPFKVKSSAIKILTNRDKNTDLKFVYEIMKSFNFPIANHKRHYISQYQELDFVVPTIKEQKQIAEVLSSLDKNIENIEKYISSTEKLKKGVLKNIFTNDTENWETYTLGDLIEIRSGDSPSNFEFSTEGYPFFKVDSMNYADKYLIESELKFSKYKKALMPKGTVIFPKRGASIFLNKVRVLGCDSYFDTNVMGLIASNQINNEFLYYFIDFTGLSRLADTTAIPQINNKHILPLKISLPPISEQEKIANILISIDNKIRLGKKLKTITVKLKKGIVADLLSGKVRTINN